MRGARPTSRRCARPHQPVARACPKKCRNDALAACREQWHQRTFHVNFRESRWYNEFKKDKEAGAVRSALPLAQNVLRFARTAMPPAAAPTDRLAMRGPQSMPAGPVRPSERFLVYGAPMIGEEDIAEV